MKDNNSVNQEWISVEDNPPTDNGYYLVFDPNAFGLREAKIDVYRFSKYNQSWYWGSDSFHPTHWMPLPPPPKP
jgi:hypothetical protein